MAAAEGKTDVKTLLPPGESKQTPSSQLKDVVKAKGPGVPPAAAASAPAQTRPSKPAPVQTAEKKAESAPAGPAGAAKPAAGSNIASGSAKGAGSGKAEQTNAAAGADKQTPKGASSADVYSDLPPLIDELD
jgi:hypothetical protein